MMVGDERPSVYDALFSVASHVEEVVLLHTGSVHWRVDPVLAWRGGASPRLVEHDEPFEDRDFARVRNRTLALASTEYALVLDDDERVVGADAFHRILQIERPDVIELSILNLHHFGSVETQRSVRVVRIGSGLRFVGPVHEVINNQSGRCFKADRPYIVHDGYADAAYTASKFYRRNHQIALEHFSQNGADARLTGVLLRDATWLVKNDGEPLKLLNDAIDRFQLNVVESEHWSEYLSWAQWFVEGLRHTGRGFMWSPDLPMPQSSKRQPQQLAFLRVLDFRRFCLWWVDEATRRTAARFGEDPPRE